MSTISDIECLPLLNLEHILDVLKSRYSDDVIYTWACTTLIAVNPCKELPNLYSQETQQMICNTLDLQKPHVYAIAERAMRMLKEPYNTVSSASIVVSGESGSGKTENTKHLLRYLTVVKSTCLTSKHLQYAKEIERRILSFSPVLEVFGNASTPCNDNSSRFGKYIVLQYDSNHVLIGSYIQTYLLEKTRAVQQTAGNYNFHIFHQFLDGISEYERQQYLVEGIDNYNYVCKSPDMGHKMFSWENTKNAWTDIGLTQDQQNDICKLLGSILCLGNTNFTQLTEDTVDITDDLSVACVTQASSLLGIPCNSLKRHLLFRQISATHSKRQSVFHKPCTLTESIVRRDCLAKLLYSSLFDFLVSHFNSSLKSDDFSYFIGLLDIYGFEVFDSNSLEQLCINYANEQLQYYFVQSYLKDVQVEYEKENVCWQSVNLSCSNDECVKLLTGSPSVFSLLNEECQLNRIVNNTNFVDKLTRSSVRDSPSFVCTQKHINNSQFAIIHYANQVTYSATNLIEKNKDEIPQDLLVMLKESSSKFVSQLVESCAPISKVKPQKKTVLSRFKKSMDELLKLLKSTECQYIRCIKPNKLLCDGIFDSVRVNKQLTACGIMETVKIRSQSHVIRISYERFNELYGVLLLNNQESRATNGSMKISPPTKFKPANIKPKQMKSSEPAGQVTNDSLKLNSLQSHLEKCHEIIARVTSSPDQLAQFGKTKIFIKSVDTINQLEMRKSFLFNRKAKVIQRAWLRYKKQCEYVKYTRHAATVIIRALRHNVIRQRMRRDMRLSNERIAVVNKAIDSSVSVRRGSIRSNRTSVCVDDITTISREFDTVKQAADIIKRTGLIWGDRVVSVRNINQVMIRMRVTKLNLLKYSYKVPKLHTLCSLLDCL